VICLDGLSHRRRKTDIHNYLRSTGELNPHLHGVVECGKLIIIEGHNASLTTDAQRLCQHPSIPQNRHGQAHHIGSGRVSVYSWGTEHMPLHALTPSGHLSQTML
jgi:hypothetical protein